MEYAVLNAERISACLAEHGRSTQVLGEGSAIEIEEIDDGNLNFVYRVRRRWVPDRLLMHMSRYDEISSMEQLVSSVTARYATSNFKKSGGLL